MDLPVVGSGAGNRTRVHALISFLVKHSYLTVIQLGRRPLYSIDHLLPPRVNIIYLDNEHIYDKERNITSVNRMLNNDDYRVCIIEYIHMSYFLKSVPEGVTTILDSHDIISDSNASFHTFNLPSFKFNLSREQEFKIFNLYDYVMLIAKQDYLKLGPELGFDRLILAPHPAQIKDRPLRPKVRRVGFIASEYTPNVDAIKWFLENVWQSFSLGVELELNIYGHVCSALSSNYISKFRSVKLNGFLEDLDSAYEEIDIAINPVRFGAGLKIKNVEALANGIPLITTSHGAGGLEGAESTFFVANSPIEFFDTIQLLVNNFQLRMEIVNSSKKWLRENFSEDRCFAGIGKLLK